MNLEDNLEYGKMADMVDAESVQTTQTSTSIDVGEIFSDTIAVRKLKYSDISYIVEKAEMKKGEVIATEEIAPEFREKISIAPQVQKQETQIQTKTAAGKLANMAGRVGKEFEENVEKKREEKLVLPKLSLEDQLSDLEKMVEGLSENVFNQQQKLIIAEEVRTLSMIAAREDVNKLSDDERELVVMRNAKIKEIKGKLHMK